MARRRGQRTGYLHKKGKSWFLQYRVDTPDTDANGKLIRSTLTKYVADAEGPNKVSRREAQRIAWEEYLSKLDQSSMRPGSMKTVREFVKERFEPGHIWALRPGGQIHYRGMLKNHVLPAIGDLKLRDVNVCHVQAMVRTIMDVKKKSGQTALHAIHVVGTMFRHAKIAGVYYGELPTFGVKLPDYEPEERRPLTWEQAWEISDAIFAVARSRDISWRTGKHGEQTERVATEVSALIKILSLSGMRIGEATGLRWRRLNLIDIPVQMDSEVLPPRCIAIREAYVRNKYAAVKSKKSKRIIPIPEWACLLFASLKARKQFIGPDDPVFCASTGRPLDGHNMLQDWLKPAAKLVGIDWAGFHSLRHGSSQIVENTGMLGTDQLAHMGHGSDKVSQIYKHSEVERRRQFMDKIQPPQPKALAAVQ